MERGELNEFLLLMDKMEKILWMVKHRRHSSGGYLVGMVVSLISCHLVPRFLKYDSSAFGVFEHRIYDEGEPLAYVLMVTKMVERVKKELKSLAGKAVYIIFLGRTFDSSVCEGLKCCAVYDPREGKYIYMTSDIFVEYLKRRQHSLMKAEEEVKEGVKIDAR